MIARLLMISGLIAIMVLGANGQFNRWLGISEPATSRSSLVSGSVNTDLRAVEAWASVEQAGKVCNVNVTDAAAALKRQHWESDPAARNIIARVGKEPTAKGVADFCAAALADYGPGGRRYVGLIEPKN